LWKSHNNYLFLNHLSLKMDYLKNLQTIIFSITFFVSLCGSVSGQVKDSLAPTLTAAKTKKKPLGDLKIKFSEDGNKYLKFGFGNQTWLRVIENNPGTSVNGVAQSSTYDAGIRRMRISATAQLSSRYLLYIQMGINNQTFISGGGTGTGNSGAGKKAAFFFHDAYNEYTILPQIDDETKKSRAFDLHIGSGLHSWNGISRMGNASAFRLLAADTPSFNLGTIEISDQFGRQFGIFAHGEWNRLAYRVNVNKPFATSLTPAVNGPAVDNNKSGKLSFAGYFDYQFFGKDNRSGPFLVGTYLGEKKMLNIGAGFYTTKDGTLTQPSEGVFKSHDITLLGADLFLEIPVGPKGKQMSITAYSVYYVYNFGPDYLRTTAIMNPGRADSNFTGTVAKEGFGNARFLLGTGQMWYTQAGFLLPKFSEKVRIQPFATYTLKDLDALAQKGSFYDIGTNILLDGHNAKITMQYGSRPLYNPITNTVFKRAGEFVTSIQIYL
jgi:hypothetical protein